METNSIQNIKNAKESIDIKLSTYKTTLKNANYTLSTEIGSENEYTIGSFITELSNILIDLSYLIRASNIFLKLSTIDERNSIYGLLNNINVSLDNFNFHNAVSYLNQLKIIIRNYHIRGDKKRFLEYNNAIDSLTKKSQEIDEIKQEIKNIKINSLKVAEEIESKKNQFDTKYDQLIGSFQELEKSITDVKSRYSELSGLVSNSETANKQIQQKLSNVTSNEKTIETFSENVSKRENQLKDQQIKTNEFVEKLNDFTNEHKKYLIEAKSLISSAREALKLNTTEGLSAAFSNQYDIANNPKMRVGWLIGSILFLLLTIVLGAWVVGGWWIDDPENIRNILGRISLLPLSLLGTLFCANQYIKQKNIAEDYAYKTVLAKSLVAFSDELKNRGSEATYSEYITTVLSEIHQDPLRKRSKEEKDFESNFNVVQKAFNWFKQIKSD